ncbi:tail fiber protein [Membranicola marinus]|uniref:Tail fiber protein n=1 Tax=Membranihabitans marinus TaxID=1227546 RepID=A0A953HJ43_9BACT|nr:tail fiber protein [Membranihabitans marinus]MBY5956814.1 tail fiber protein [Membranihabitans marinus]
MAEPYVGEIRMFAGNFAPRGWAFCDGQLLAVSQNDALFSLLGTIYGGDGRTTFGLPDLRGRLPIHAGTGPGLSPRRLGAKGGAEKVTLTVNQLPSHNHEFKGTNDLSSSPNPEAHVVSRSTDVDAYIKNEAVDQNLNSDTLTKIGASQSHTNLMPYLCVHFIIALFGIYPSRH